MAKLSILAGTTSKLLRLFIMDSSKTDGSGLTGLVYNAAGLTCYYIREGASSATSVTLATMTVGTWATGGFKEIDSTNMPGAYEFGIPDAAIASSAKSVYVHFKGAANMAPLPLEIELTAWNNQDAVRGGMTALPNANAAANGGLPTGDASNSVKIQSAVKKNTALSAFEFCMRDTTGALKTGLTVTGQRSIDGAAFGACANSVSEVSNGFYKIDLAAADVNGNVIGLRFSATGAQDTVLTLITMP